MAKILYIEDIQDNITLVEKIVKSRGHEFLFAWNAEEGLELAFASRPDLILLDLGLPDADGRALGLCMLGFRENDPHLPAFRAMGYFTNFSRIEMRRTQK